MPAKEAAVIKLNRRTRFKGSEYLNPAVRIMLTDFSLAVSYRVSSTHQSHLIIAQTCDAEHQAEYFTNDAVNRASVCTLH